MPHLDNPAWYALSGLQAEHGAGGRLARRYRTDIDPIAALPDAPRVDSWESLAGLVAEDGPLILLRTHFEVPAGWTSHFEFAVLQMVATRPIPHPTDLRARELTSEDEREMLALARATEPGPFAIHTRALGSYIGVHEGDRLVAMAGQRFHLDGYREVSAVCTDPAYRGRGLAAALTAEVAARIVDSGEVPFLHVRQDNVGAVRVYERMGFETRAVLRAVGVTPTTGAAR